jgi:hypothetical protein
MIFFTQFILWIEQIDRHQMQKYIYIVIGIILGLTVLLGWQYFNTVAKLNKKINSINGIREDVRGMRQMMLQVNTQRTAVNEMLAEEVNFKIVAFFNSVLAKLNIVDNKKTEEVSQIDREDQYRETELNVTMADMDMKQVTELLFELEQKKRIYIKKLDIEKSKKGQNTLEIILIIATLSNKESE